MQISRRLMAVAEMVTPGHTLADVGTDHGYIPIYLTREGRIRHALAMDVNPGPLERAREHIRQYGLEDEIETRLSDGLDALGPGEANSIIIAGMGGPLTVRILKHGLDRLTDDTELILQPQSEIMAVREYLFRNGYRLEKEEMIFEDGKYYPMMRACKKEQSKDCAVPGREELFCGPLLLAGRHPVLRKYLERENEKNGRILTRLIGEEGEASRRRLAEVKETMQMIDRILAGF